MLTAISLTGASGLDEGLVVIDEGQVVLDEGLVVELVEGREAKLVVEGVVDELVKEPELDFSAGGSPS